MDIMSRFAGDTHTRLVLNGVPTIQVKKSGPQYQSIVGLSGKSGNTQYLILLNKDTNRSVGVKIPVESLGLGSKVKYDKYDFSSSAWNTPSASFSKVVENRIEETGVIHNTSVPFRSAVVFVI